MQLPISIETPRREHRRHQCDGRRFETGAIRTFGPAGVTQQPSLGMACLPRIRRASESVGQKVMLLKTYPVLKTKRIACWNVRTLCGPTGLNDRKTAGLNEEMKRLSIDTAALAETGLSGSGSLREKDYTIFWQGKGECETREQGVGFAIKMK